MRRNKKKTIYYVLILLILGIGIGYAYLNTTLNINGTTNVSSASWNIYWDNIVLGNHNTTDVVTPATIKTGDTEVEFNVNFKEPGDTYEFTVDAVNDGTIDAMISVVSNGVYAINETTPKALPDYLEYTVTYSDGVPIAQNNLLAAGQTETYKVRVHYKEDISSSQLPSTADNFLFKFAVTYVQADSNAKSTPHPVSFSTDSLDTIVMAVQTGSTSAYHVGDTKTLDMGSLGMHTVRIANMSTPNECSTTGFSQTACGFVLEFVDIITPHQMNPDGEYKGIKYDFGRNVDGWPACSMREHVNNDIYNALPTDLKNAIINTTVVSGHGSTAGETNFTSTDKLYLLSSHEVFEDADGNPSGGIDYYDTGYNSTRQLDYYSNLGVTTSNYSGASKSNSWWLREAISVNVECFGCVNGVGNWDISAGPSSNMLGVSPAFRIG